MPTKRPEVDFYVRRKIIGIFFFHFELEIFFSQILSIIFLLSICFAVKNIYRNV